MLITGANCNFVALYLARIVAIYILVFFILGFSPAVFSSAIHLILQLWCSTFTPFCLRVNLRVILLITKLGLQCKQCKGPSFHLVVDNRCHLSSPLGEPSCASVKMKVMKFPFQRCSAFCLSSELS